jgi:hypothetical protein
MEPDWANIDARIFDAMIAEKVFGWRWLPMPESAKAEVMNPAFCRPMFCPPNKEWGLYDVPHFTTDDDAAREVMWLIVKRAQSFRADYDKNYGVEKQTGWSITVDGVVLVSFCGSFNVALCFAAMKYFNPEG